MLPRSMKKTVKNPAASCLYFLHFFVLAVSGEDVTGSVNDTLILPCTYLIHKYLLHSMCWGQGNCALLGCNNYIISTDGQKVIWRKSDRYQLLGNISQGDVSLTITGAANEDEGTYCCRVEIPGLFNDVKEEVNVKIQEGTTGRSVTKVLGDTTQEDTFLTTVKFTTEDVTKEINVQIFENQKRLNWNTLTNVIRCIIILLVPTMFLLIYKCCSLYSYRP